MWDPSEWTGGLSAVRSQLLGAGLLAGGSGQAVAIAVKQRMVQAEHRVPGSGYPPPDVLLPGSF